MKNFLNTLKWFFRICKENFIYKKKCGDIEFSFKDEDFTIMSFNIRRDCEPDGKNNWTYRKESIVKMINEYTPDVICMQEVMPHMAKYLVQELSGSYDYVGLECFTNKELSKSYFVFGEGMMTFYKKNKFTLVHSDYMKLFDGRILNVRRASILTLTDKNHKEYHVFNTHFCHKDRDCRRKSFEKIYDYIKSHNLSNIFVVGDFNCETTWINNGIDLFLKNFYYNQPNRKGSINSFKYSDYNITIDFIFSDKNYTSSEVIYKNYDVEFLSDHYPLLHTYENIQ